MTNPHDKLFKAAFSRPEVVASLIEDLFPPELAQRLRLDSLALTPNSYIDDALDEHFADLVYTVKLDDDDQAIDIALLLEHKSYTVAHPHLQLLRYMLNRWEQDAEHDRALTPIIPVVIYHGESRWQQKPLQAYLSGWHPVLEPYLPEFDYVLINLSTLPDNRILAFRSRFLAVSSALLKYRSSRHYVAFVRQYLAQLLAGLSESELPSIVLPTFLYLSETTDLEGVDIFAIFETLSSPAKNIFMTTADRLRTEGRMEGRIEERREVIHKVVRGALKIGMDAETIALTFDFSLAEVQEIVESMDNGQ
jgi:predicted transposase/invertase (TIGR01784 family)